MNKYYHIFNFFLLHTCNEYYYFHTEFKGNYDKLCSSNMHTLYLSRCVFFQAIFSKLCVFYAEPNNFWMWKTYINTTQNEILVARKGKLVDSYFGKQNPGLVEMCSVVFVWCCWKKQPTNKPTDTAEYLKKWNNFMHENPWGLRLISMEWYSLTHLLHVLSRGCIFKH